MTRADDVRSMLDGRPLAPTESAGGVFLSRTPPLVPPIYQSSTFELDDQSYRDIQENEGLGETWYTRFGNPTVAAAAARIAELERAESAAMTSSGMGAIATVLLTLCKAGDRIVSARELYGDTRDLLVRDLPRLGVKVDFVPGADSESWRRVLGDEAALAYMESLTNPQLLLLDVPQIAELAHQAGARLVVDNTLASPYVLRPLEWGADVVVHSATKSLNGHSDVVAGAVASDRAFIRDVQRRIITFGTSLDPHAAFLVSRGLKTFEVRLERQTRTAASVARFLADSDDVHKVIHPSLPSFPSRDVSEKLLDPDRTGAMVTFVLAGGDERALRFMRSLSVPTEATSLGGVESLVSAPFNSSHFSLSTEERKRAGIVPGMVRMSIGLESADVLIGDIEKAIEASRVDAGTGV